MRKLRYVVIVAVIALDQLVKYAIRANMNAGDSKDVIGTFFSITYIRNNGAAFSILSGQGIFLIAAPILAIAVAIWYMETHRRAHWTLFLGLELIISGGLGNWIDRVALGWVTDMFDFHFWPVFNIADIAICVGCFFMVLFVMLYDKDDKKKEAPITRL